MDLTELIGTILVIILFFSFFIIPIIAFKVLFNVAEEKNPRRKMTFRVKDAYQTINVINQYLENNSYSRQTINDEQVWINREKYMKITEMAPSLFKITKKKEKIYLESWSIMKLPIVGNKEVSSGYQFTSYRLRKDTKKIIRIIKSHTK